MPPTPAAAAQGGTDEDWLSTAPRLLNCCASVWSNVRCYYGKIQPLGKTPTIKTNLNASLRRVQPARPCGVAPIVQGPTATHGKKSPQKPATTQATTIIQLVAALPCTSHTACTFPASLGAPHLSLHDGDHCRPNVRYLTSLSGRKANKNYIGRCTWMWRSFLYQPQERGTSTDVVAVAGAPRHFRGSAKKIRRLVRAGALILCIDTNFGMAQPLFGASGCRVSGCVCGVSYSHDEQTSNTLCAICQHNKGFHSGREGAV